MRVMLMGGLQCVKGIWRSRRVVPEPLRPYLPPPFNNSGKGGRPIGSLTKTTSTGNKTEAIRIARRENHQGLFDQILAQAVQNMRQAQKEAGIDWVAQAEWAERMDLIHTDYHDWEMAQTVKRVLEKQQADQSNQNTNKLADEVVAQLKREGIIPQPKKVVPVPFDSIIENWIANKKPTPGKTTQQVYARMMRDLAKVIGHDDAAQLTPGELEKFRNARLAGGAGELTVYHDMRGIKTILRWGVFKDLITVNPMDKVKLGKKPDSERNQAYTKEQVARIVLEGRNQPDEIKIPTLIAAYGGQRLSEVMDCSTLDIVHEEGHWCLDIRMKHRMPGTRLKNGQSVRTVPLHPSIVNTVLEYRNRICEKHGDGPLFPMVKPDEQNRRGNRAGKRIGYWIRHGLGITDEDIAPMHAFRHYVRTELYDQDVDPKTRDHLTGHAGGPESRKYEHPPIPKLAKAIALLPDPLAGVSRIA